MQQEAPPEDGPAAGNASAPALRARLSHHAGRRATGPDRMDP